MPTDPCDEHDRTGETPLVVPVSDSIGAVDLDPVGGEPTAEATTGVSSEAPGGAPTVQGDIAEPAAVRTSEAPVTRASRVATPVGGVPVYEVPGYVTDERRRGRWPRRVVIGLAVVVVLAVVYYGFTLWQVWSTGRSDEARPVDALVVMGAAQYDGRPSPQLEARLDHVVTLWEDGLAPTVIVTGGNLPGDRFTEAEASGSYLIEQGVPAASILYENAGSNSYESLAGVAAIMSDRRLGEALIVTDPYHALRSKLIAEELGITAHVSPTPTSVVTGVSELRRVLGEAGGVALGRIIGFDRLASLTG